MEVSQKLKIELPYRPVISLLGINSEELESVCLRDSFSPVLIVALFTVPKIQKQT
jgi:hypothetical protein